MFRKCGFEYDAAGQLKSTLFPENGLTRYAYNGGRLVSKIDAKNQEIRWEYDANKRLSVIRRYRVAGGAEDAALRTNFYYDGVPWCVPGFTASNTSGGLAAVEYAPGYYATPPGYSPGRFREVYSYTAAGGVTRKRMFVENGISMEVQLAYDIEGKVTTMQYPSGDIHRYVYNAAGRQTEMQERFVSEQGVESWQTHSTATYGDVGEMIGMTGPFGSQTWGYNSRMQMTTYTLAGSLSLTYKYDEAGQNDGKLTEL